MPYYFHHAPHLATRGVAVFCRSLFVDDVVACSADMLLMCCGVLQCVAVCYRALYSNDPDMLFMCCGVLQRVAVCCSVLPNAMF